MAQELHAEMRRAFSVYKSPIMENREVFMVMLLGRLYAGLYPKVAAATFKLDAFELSKKEYVMSLASAGFVQVHDSIDLRTRNRTDSEFIDHVATLSQRWLEVEIAQRWRTHNGWLESIGQPPYQLEPLDGTAAFRSEGYEPETTYERLEDKIRGLPDKQRTAAFVGTIAFEEIKRASFVQLAAEAAYLKPLFQEPESRPAA